MFRKISLAIRFLQSFKERKKMLATFADWQHQLQQLHNNKQAEKKLLLIIRLDDIGDYILFRNSLPLYKASTKWKDYSIHLLGNAAWKSLFETFDEGTVDEANWINKHSYHNDETYRLNTWKQLRAKGYETVICPSYTRPLLLDDLCMLATDAPIRIASPNTYKFEEWNKLSDALYTSLFPVTELMHEFFFNQAFSSWCNGILSKLKRPELHFIHSSPLKEKYIICFIGANAKSRRWPALRWIELIELIQKNYNYTIVIAYGRNEKTLAAQIEEKVKVYSLDEKITLPEMATWIASAEVVVSNNTMAAQLSVACNTPTVIVDSGDHFYRFTNYKSAGIENVITLYPDVFLRYWKKRNFQPFQNYTTVTKDIATIPATLTYTAFKQLLTEQEVYEK